MARYLLDAWDEYGNRVQLPVEWCWRCGVPIYTNLVSIDEHIDREHPIEAPPRHALREDTD